MSDWSDLPGLSDLSDPFRAALSRLKKSQKIFFAFLVVAICRNFAHINSTKERKKNMKSTFLKSRALYFATMFALLIAGLSFTACASEDGEDQEESPILGTWQQQASSTGTHYESYYDNGNYEIKNPEQLNTQGNIEHGKYTFANNTLTCNPVGKVQRIYSCVFNGDRLTMTPANTTDGVKEFKRFYNTKAIKRAKK